MPPGSWSLPRSYAAMKNLKMSSSIVQSLASRPRFLLDQESTSNEAHESDFCRTLRFQKKRSFYLLLPPDSTIEQPPNALFLRKHFFSFHQNKSSLPHFFSRINRDIFIWQYPAQFLNAGIFGDHKRGKSRACRRSVHAFFPLNKNPTPTQAIMMDNASRVKNTRPVRNNSGEFVR